MKPRMARNRHIFVVAAVVWTCIVAGVDACADLDEAGCVSLLAQNSKLCQQEVFAFTACAKTCGRCPLTCYFCDNTVTNAGDCNLVKTCQPGEKCMLTTISSTKDGHTELKMDCATVDVCDGGGVFFGRRDVSAHCCSNDLCNKPTQPVTNAVTNPTAATTTTHRPTTQRTTHAYHATKPTTTTTTTTTPAPTTTGPCVRDIIVMIEDSSDQTADIYVQQFLKTLVAAIPMGHDLSSLRVALYNRIVEEQISVERHFDHMQLLHDIDTLAFSHHSDTIDTHEVLAAMETYLGGHHNVPNELIIISDHAVVGHHAHPVNPDDLRHSAQGVTVINVGAEAISGSVFAPLATSPEYVLNTNSYVGLPALLNKVVSLICR